MTAAEVARLQQQAETNLETAAYLFQQARKARNQARNDLAEAVREAVGTGMSEVRAAQLAGVTRMTVRAWLGKGDGLR